MGRGVRIAFFGLPLAGLLLLADGHDLVLAASPRRDAPGNRRLRGRLGKRFLSPRAEDPALASKVKASGAELLVSWFWTTLLPAPVLAACPLGAIGVHPSLLPRHRGPDPYFWAIDRGDTTTGVTAHRLEAAYDTGAILAQRTLAIDPAWNAWQLAKALDRPSLSLLREVVNAFARGEPPPSIPQDEALATLAPAPDDELSMLRFDRPTEAVLRRVRALAPAPGAFTEIGDTPVCVVEAERARRFPGALLPGEAAVIDGRAVVRTADGAVALLAAHLDGADPDDPALSAAALAHLVTAAKEGDT
jgi:methionyl-tRNA formyltransferase